MSLPGYDAWATGGRYDKQLLRATCTHCGEQNPVTAETEYGATTWTPEECPECHKPWGEDAPWEDDEPDPDAAYDRMREDRDDRT